MSGPTLFNEDGEPLFTPERPGIVVLGDLLEYIHEMRNVYDETINLKQKLDETLKNVGNGSFTTTNNILNNVKTDMFKGFCAHRGFCSSAPENTLKAITEAGRNGFKMVEIDPAITTDGVWVLMHDSTVDRTTNGTGTWGTMTLAQIQSLKIDTPASLIGQDEVIRIPLLEEVVKECAKWGMGINMDGSKFNWTANQLTYFYNLLDAHNLAEKSWIVCPQYSQRQLVKTTTPRLAVAWVSSVGNVDNDIEEAKQYQRAIVGYSSGSLTDEVIAKCNKAGLEILAHTANDINSAYRWIKSGVSFIETDYVLPEGIV